MKCAIVDERISEKCERGLLLRGFQIIKCPPSEFLGEAVKSHPDMLMFHYKNRIISSAKYCESFPYVFSDIREMTENTEFTFSDENFTPEYPSDAIFNALTVGDFIFLKEDTVSQAVIRLAKKIGLEIVPVKQGYPSCTTLAFGNSAITADKGMEKALLRCGINVTLISNGDISLFPHEYGFIGGASGVYKNEVYFLGSLESHKDSIKIREALERENYTPVSLSDEPLCDLGRIIFVD